MRVPGRIIAYIRVSTQEQAESGLGLDAQLEAIHKAFGELSEVFRDEGYSGSDANRPGLLSALESLKKGDTLAVAKRDRLARDAFLSLWIEKETKKHGAVIRSAAGEGTEKDSPADVLMRRMVDAFAEYEREIIRRRTAAAVRQKMNQKRDRLEKLGGAYAPYGFDAVMGSNAIKRLVPNAGEQQVIQLIAQLRKRGLSFRGIGRHLEAKGIMAKSGKPWSPKVIRGILVRQEAA